MGPRRFLPLAAAVPVPDRSMSTLSPTATTMEGARKPHANVPSWHQDGVYAFGASRDAAASPAPFDHGRSRDVSQESASLENARRNQILQHR